MKKVVKVVPYNFLKRTHQKLSNAPEMVKIGHQGAEIQFLTGLYWYGCFLTQKWGGGLTVKLFLRPVVNYQAQTLANPSPYIGETLYKVWAC